MTKGHPTEVACLLCDAPTAQGVRIGAFRICAECEAGLVRAAPGEPGYDEIVTRLRPIGLSALSAVAGQSAFEVDFRS